MPMFFRLLGPFEVLPNDSSAAYDLPQSRKARALLAYLASAVRETPKANLIDLFFAETRDPKGGLRWAVSRLRAALSKELICTSSTSLWLDTDQFRTDLEYLERPIPADASIADLKEIESSIRGEFLADLSVAKSAGFEAWRLAKQVNCGHRHATILSLLIRKTLGSPAASDHARRLVNLDVSNEDAWALLIESLLAVNQVPEARHVQRLAIEQLERDGVRLTGKLEKVWTTYGLDRGAGSGHEPDPNNRSLGLRPRVAVLRCRHNGADDESIAAIVAEVIFRACNVNKVVTVFSQAMSARIDSDSDSRSSQISDFNVDLLLESSIGKRNGELLIEVELIDASTGDCIFTWRKTTPAASRSDIAETLEAYLAARMEIDLPIALVSRVREKPSNSLTARDLYLLALPRLFSADGFDPFGAYELLEGALSRQPYFGQASCALSLIRLFMPQYNDNDDQLEITLSMARRAVEICQDDAFVLGIAAVNIAHITRRSETGLALVQHALSINPYSVMAGLSAAMISHYGGDDQSCIRYVDAVESNSETEPVTFFCHTCRAMASYQQRDYAAALEWSRKAVGHNPKHVIALRYLLASLAQTGALDEAHALARQIAALDPSENVAFFRRRTAYVDEQAIEHLCEGLQLGGLPETA